MKDSIILLSPDEFEELIRRNIQGCIQTMQLETQNSLPKLFSAKDVAISIGCSVRSVYGYKDAGKLKSISLEGLVRFRKQDVDEFIRRYQG